MKVFEIQQWHPVFDWEIIPGGDFEDLECARKAMANLEQDLGWRNMRIAAYVINDGRVVEGTWEIVEYGLD